MRIKLLKTEKATREHGGIRLRPFPHPYRAAVAICNDIDGTSPRLFTAVHRLLSCEGETGQGLGLGLEVADSLFVWSNHDQVVGLLDHNDNPTHWDGALAALCHQRWIDSLHALGDFNSASGFSRKRAKIAYRLLEEMGIRLKVWINHGNSNNVQNLYARLGPSFSGDDPGSAACHHDLADEYGIRWYWWHELADLPLSAEHPEGFRLTRRLFVNSLKNIAKRAVGNADMRRPSGSFRELALPVELRDGGAIWAFTRYSDHPEGIWTRPGRHTLRHQLSEAFLERLLRWGGYAIVYTHLGLPDWDGESPLFDPPDLQALLRLKERSENGDILVAATARLLEFWLVSRHLRWQVNQSAEGATTIDITAVDDPVSGERIPAAEELEGLAFYCPEPRRTSVRLDGVGIPGFVPFAADDTGRGGIHLPWRKLDPPHNLFAL